jgi:murein DD-endopeptidase MepM/ murein hydrolase activator NlpD
LIIVVTVGLAALILSVLAIHILYKEFNVLEHRRQQLQLEHDRLLSQNRDLDDSISRQNLKLVAANRDLNSVSVELASMTDDLAEIESLIGLRPAEDAATAERLDVAGQTALEKVIMLNSIPSGVPIDYTRVSSPFGMRIDPKTGKKKFHQGVDLKAEDGTAVHATADGIVEFAAADKTGGFGNLIVIVHNFGFKTFYGHLKAIGVEAGDFVAQSQQIGESGRSGRATGPHLHYEIRRLQGKLDPGPFIDWTIENYASLFEQEKRVPWDSLAKAVKKRIATTTLQLSLKEPKSAAN